MGRAAETDRVLSALDPKLEPFGFRRRRGTQEWYREPDELHRDYVHLNFGLAGIEPSMCVEYRDLSALVPKEMFRCLASGMLSTVSAGRKKWFFSTHSDQLATDITEYGIPFLEKLHDRNWVIEQLMIESPCVWPVSCYSAKIRLLPLLLTLMDRTADALHFLDRELPLSAERDQILPFFPEFVVWFRSKFSASPLEL